MYDEIPVQEHGGKVENSYTIQSYIPIITIQKKIATNQQKRKFSEQIINLVTLSLFSPNKAIYGLISDYVRQGKMSVLIFDDIRNMEMQVPTNFYINNENNIKKNKYYTEPTKPLLLVNNDGPTTVFEPSKEKNDLENARSPQEVVLESIEEVPGPTNPSRSDKAQIWVEKERQQKNYTNLKSKTVVKKENPEKYMPKIGNFHEEKIRRKLQSIVKD